MTTVLFVMRERALSCLALFGIGRAVLRFYRARIAPQRISRARHRSLGFGFSAVTYGDDWLLGVSRGRRSSPPDTARPRVSPGRCVFRCYAV
jgi:hypothetical protein